MELRPLLLAAMLAALAAPVRAEDASPPPARSERKPRTARAEPLSAEDAEVVKQLALLEQVELLRNLELFEGRPQDSKPQAAKQQDDVLPPDAQREP